MISLQISKYNLLKKLVESNQLQLFLMLSTPRTRSTALQIACAQTKEIDMQISAPFSNQAYGPISFYHDNNTLVPGKDLRQFETGCEKIYDTYAKVDKRNKRSATGLLVYEALSRLLDAEMHQLLQLTRHVIIPIRDPYLQFASFLVQYFHDYFTGDSNKYLKSSQVFNLLKTLKEKSARECDLLWDEYIRKEAVAKILNKTPETVKGEDILTVLNKMIAFIISELDIIWLNLEHCLRVLFKSQSYKSHTIVIVDGENLVQQPQEVLRNICEQLQLSFGERMASQWKKSSGNKFRSGHPTNDRLLGWSAPAKESTGIHKDNDSIDIAPRLEDFPKEMHGLLKKAWVIYQNCLSRPELIRVPRLQTPSATSNADLIKELKTETLSGKTDQSFTLSSAQLIIQARKEYAPTVNRKGKKNKRKEDESGFHMELRSSKHVRHPK